MSRRYSVRSSMIFSKAGEMFLLPRAMRYVVLALANHSNATIYFPYEKDNPAYAYAEKLLKDPALTTKLGTRPTPAQMRGTGLLDEKQGRARNAEHGSRISSLSIPSSAP